MESTSGATLTVRKSAPIGKARNRLFAQAEWLKQFDSPNIVKVLEVTADGYTMPYLEPTLQIPPDYLAGRIIAVLSRDVWQKQSMMTFKPSLFREYVHRFGNTDLDDFTVKMLPQILRQEFVETHGDPTFENALSLDGELVLVDPLPDPVQDGRMPSVRAVDLGKILQSALGYEAVKRGLLSSYILDLPTWRTVRYTCDGPEEWDLARYFCALHIARFIPYQTPDLGHRWMYWYASLLELLSGPSFI